MNAINHVPVVDQIFGLNKAPIEEVLRADFALLLDEADALLVAADHLPSKIASEADQISVATYIAKARAFWKNADGQRENEKRITWRTSRRAAFTSPAVTFHSLNYPKPL